jgi:signal transduction histidine kinase
LLAIVALWPVTAVAEAPVRKDVLLLYADSMLLPANVVTDRELRSALGADAGIPVRFYTEALDLSWFPDKEVERATLELLRAKYANRNLALVIPVGPPAIRFALLHRATIFPGVPLVFIAARQAALADLPLPPDVTGMWLDRDWRTNVDLILRLHPDTRRIAFVGGGGTTPTTAEEFRRVAASYRDRFEPIELTDRTFEEMLQEAAALPEHTVILVGLFLRDRAGRTFTNAEVAEHVARSASVPVYSALDVHIGRGIVGGYVVRWDVQAQRGAALALRVLRGEQPGPAAATSEGTNAHVFDARVLARWGIDRRSLPPGSIVLFHEPSLWERYRGYVIGAISVVIVQSGLIGALLVHRAQRRRAQRTLTERLRFETLLSDLSARLSACPVGQVDQQITTGLRRIVEDLGVDAAGVWAFPDQSDDIRLAHSWSRVGVPPLPTAIQEKDAPQFFSRLRQGHVVRLSSSDPDDEPRIGSRDLARLGMQSIAVAPLVAGGSVMGGLAIGSAGEARLWPDELMARLRLLADVFAHTLARQRAEHTATERATQIQALAGRLITAQEEERRRIARELHDGVNQKVTALSIALTTLGRRAPEGAVDLVREVARLQERAASVVDDIRHLSHELHPGVLEHIGLVAALEGYCREFEDTHGVSVTFRADQDLGVMSTDLALCLYRATQEALGNVAKHAKAQHVEVSVAADGDKVALIVADDGCGFDATGPRRRHGLGLVSLEERIRLVDGQITINTGPRRGTEVRIVVPLREGSHAPADGPAG